MTNTVYDIATIKVCTSCVLMHANGEAFATLEETKAWEQGFAREGWGGDCPWRWSGTVCDDADAEGYCHERELTGECITEGWFSWSWCEGCGDTDGGTRYNMAIMRRIA